MINNYKVNEDNQIEIPYKGSIIYLDFRENESDKDLIKRIQKIKFFKTHIGHKIKLTTGKFKGWLIIKSLKEIAIKDDTGRVFRIDYNDIEYVYINNDNFILNYHRLEEINPETGEFLRKQYEDGLIESVEKGLPVKPLIIK